MVSVCGFDCETSRDLKRDSSTRNYDHLHTRQGLLGKTRVASSLSEELENI